MRNNLTGAGVGLVALVATLILSVQLQAVQTQFRGSDGLQPGRIIERVACANNPNQTYALYLPPNYSAARTWPLIAAFDPGARGNAPVERFKEAAERYGYIVCGSNNSRNGPMNASAEAAKAMLGDVASRFSIDDKRVYLTGFSGGARAATAIAALLSGRVAGVIGCGAGLAGGLEASSSLPFVYYGVVGNEDFNYPEMKQLDRALESAGVTYRVEVFEGGHSWPPADACVRAVEWMELQAMQSGRRSRDDSFIDRLFNNAQQSASAHESASRGYEAYAGYAGIAADFNGIRDVAEFEKKAALLKDTKAIRQAISKDRDWEDEQRRRVTELFSLRARLRDPAISAALNETGNPAISAAPGETGTPAPFGTNAQSSGGDYESRQTAFSDLKSKLADLKRKSDAKEVSPERAFARRILNQFLIASFERSQLLIQTGKYDLATSNLTTDADLLPDNWRVLYTLACAYALKGDKRRAIDALNKSAQKGFSNASELESNRLLDAIREEAGFKKIVENLKQKQ